MHEFLKIRTLKK